MKLERPSKEPSLARGRSGNRAVPPGPMLNRSEEHTSELQSLRHLVCRLLLEKKKKNNTIPVPRHNEETRAAINHRAKIASDNHYVHQHLGKRNAAHHTRTCASNESASADRLR